MSVKIRILALSLLLSGVASLARAQETTVRYEPAVVQLTGTVALERHYGPPGYGSTPRMDKVLTIPVLVLSNPVSVQGNPQDPRSRVQVDTGSFAHVTRMQMIAETPGLKLASLVGEKITVSGTLFQKVFGENFTDVLVSVRGVTLSVR